MSEADVRYTIAPNDKENERSAIKARMRNIVLIGGFMDNKFPYGTDVNKYIEKALQKKQVAHPWATLDMFNKKYSYAIEEKNGRFAYVSYYKWDGGEIERNEYDYDGDRFIELIIGNNESWVESANPVKDVFEIPISGGIDICGWTLERYEFRTHKLGGYSSMIQAGNRYTGGNREFFIPPSFFEGTFEEFLEKYNEMVPGAFGLDESYLAKIPELKAFLGFEKQN